jgi:L-seryl-tRNA(Ser) seleniumtransferase
LRKELYIEAKLNACSRDGCKISVYKDLGLKRVINAGGTYTSLGGSRMPPEVIEAWVEASRSFVDMEALHRRAGEVIAEITGAEAGLVVSGASGALLLGGAACIAGGDREKMKILPHSEGMSNEIIFPGGPGGYGNCYMAGGARIITVGNSRLEFAEEEVEAAITESTAALGYVLSTPAGEEPLKRLISLGRKHGIPVIVDAAAELPPIENLKRIVAWGADLVAFSGGKDIMGPNDTGILCGRKHLVESAFMQACPHNLVGRALKVSKEDIIASVTALRRYVSLDHEERKRRWKEIVEYWMKEWEGVPHINVLIVSEGQKEGGRYLAQGWPRARIIVDEKSLGSDVDQIVRSLWEGDPSMYVDTEGSSAGDIPGSLILNPHLLTDEEVEYVARRVREVLTCATLKNGD